MNDDNIQNQITPETYMPSGVLFIRWVYWFLLSTALIVLIGKVLGFDRVKNTPVTDYLLNSIVDSLILIGLYRRRSWIIPLILIDASRKLVWRFLHVVGGNASDPTMLTQKLFSIVFAAICLYQIYVFTRKEIKVYFHWKGQAII
jgi:hypothetical protein